MAVTPTLFESAEQLFSLLTTEFQDLQQAPGSKLVCLASGSTFADFYRSLGCTSSLLRVPLTCTHLDEYVDFGPDKKGGMAWELFQNCAALAQMHAEGRFFAFPHRQRDLDSHRARIAALGGVGLQLLGIGRNGHLAFNEPGSQLDSHFKSVQLHPWTIADMGSRFAPESAPLQALSAGLADILGAQRVVLVARGKGKAEVVRRMLRDPIDADCPASFLRAHANLHVLLDQEAASLL